MIAITGASGGGKSSIVETLAGRGFAVQGEIGREIVKEQLACGGVALPWTNPVAFGELLFERSLDAFDVHRSSSHETIFFDRTFIEALAYKELIGEPLPKDMLKEAERRRFGDPVFVCPPWEEIFENDEERRHDFDFAVADYEANVKTYASFGYELVEIPKASINDRVDSILERLGITGND